MVFLTIAKGGQMDDLFNFRHKKETSSLKIEWTTFSQRNN
jgi:hypothetical protein